MAERLPSRGESPYYDILVPWLQVAHNADGTLKGSLASLGPTTIVAIGGQSNLVDVYNRPIASGTIQEAAFYSRIDGVAAGGVTAGRLAGIFEAQTGGGTDPSGGNPIWGLNVGVQQNAADTAAQVVGIELDVNSNKADIVLDAATTQAGLSLVSSGSKRAGIAMLIGGAPKWIEGIQIAQNAIDAGGFAFRYKGNGGGVFSVDVAGNLAVPGTLVNTGLATVNGGLQIGSGGSFAAGRFYRDGTNGVQFAGVAGSSNEFLWYNAAGSIQLLSLNAQVFTFGPTGSSVQVKINSDRNLAFGNQTSSAGAGAGTIGNAPHAGNPDFWLRTIVNGTNVALPCWNG
jgi:hypothetical protein